MNPGSKKHSADLPERLHLATGISYKDTVYEWSIALHEENYSEILNEGQNKATSREQALGNMLDVLESGSFTPGEAGDQHKIVLHFLSI